MFVMKGTRYIILAVFTACALVSIDSIAQTDVVNEVKETIKAGSAKELANYLHSTIDVTIDNTVQTYSKAQAEFVFRDFFKQHPATEFNIIHQGSSKGGQPFAIGQYKSGTDTYRVFMKIKTVSNMQLVHEISFVKE